MRRCRWVGLVGVQTLSIFAVGALAAVACGKGDALSSDEAPAAGAPSAAGSSDTVSAAGASNTAGVGATSGAAAVATGGEQTSMGGSSVSVGGASAGGAANAEAGGAANAGTAGVGNVSRGTVAAGTCGIARRIRVPSSNPGSQLRREAGGFVSGPWSEARNSDDTLPMSWLVVDSAGEPQTVFHATAPSGIGGNSVIHFGAPEQAVGFTAITFGTGPAEFMSAALQDSNAAAPSFVSVFKLSSFWQRVAFMSATAALDGQRAVFAAGSGPDFSMAVIAPDGSVVGASHTLTSTDEIPTCPNLQPTDHAGAFSVVEPTPEGEAFHRLELTALGDIASEVTVPLHRARPADWRASSLPCPLLALTQQGFALLAFETVGDRDGWYLHRVAGDGTVSDELWDTLPFLPRGFAIQGAVAFAVTTSNEAGVTIVKRSNGQDQKFPIDTRLTILGSDGPFPSEAGSLFLDVRPSGEAAQIVELSCP